MRKFSKLSLLLAPLMLSTVGCANPLRMSSKTDAHTPESRSRRLLTVAQQYEQDGKPEMATVLYERILAQDPTDPVAQSRLHALANQGVKPAPSSIRQQQTYPTLPSFSPSQAEMLARAGQNSPAVATPAAAPSALARNSVAPPAAATRLDPARSAVTQQKSLQPAATSVAKAAPALPAPAQPVSEAPPEGLLAWETTPAAAPALPDASTANPRADLFLTTAMETRAAGVSEEAGWKTSSFERVTAASASKPEPAATDAAIVLTPQVEDSWNRTRLVSLCENLPEHLIPAAEMLDSPVVAERIAGLHALGDEGEAARGASIAVTALLEDSDPLVAVNAAGVLRDISGDAWNSVKTLSAHLQNEDQEVVRLSAYLLGQMGPEAMEAAGQLETLRDAGQGVTSLHAAEALTRITPDDPQSVAVLTSALLDDEEATRWFAAVSLGTVSGRWQKDAAQALTTALKDSRPEVRAAAALSLGGLSEHGAIAMGDLERCALEENPEVRDAAVTALACLKE